VVVVAVPPEEIGRSHRSYGQHHRPRSPPRRRNGREFYARNDRRARYSRSPDRDRRRNSRRELSRSRSRSRSRRPSSRDRVGRSKRRRSYTPSSYSGQSSASSRSGSPSSDESSRSRSRSPRKDAKDRNRSLSSDSGRGGSARKRHERLPHRSHADTREKGDRSHPRDETRDRRRRSLDNNKKVVRSNSSSSSSDTKRGREREATPGAKRHRSISVDESNKRPKDSSGAKNKKEEEKEVCAVPGETGNASEREAAEGTTQ